MSPKGLYAALAVGLMLCSRGAYFSSILKGRTKPHAFSWLIWGVISSIGFAAQVAEGAGPAAYVRGFGCLTCFFVLGLSLFKGERNIRRADWLTLALAALAIPLWVITKTPVWSVILVCLIDTSGYLPTARKVWRKPRQETPYSYMFSCLGAFLSLLAIENYTPSTYLYPAMLTCSNCVMACFILLRRHLTHPRRVRARRAKARAARAGTLSAPHW